MPVVRNGASDKGTPLENLNITLEQVHKTKDDDGEKNDAQEIGFPATDKNGEAQTILNTGGNGAYTYTDGVQLNGQKQPTQYVAIASPSSGRSMSKHATWYDNASGTTGKAGSDTGRSPVNYSYNLNNSHKSGVAFGCGAVASKEPNAPSDSWHLIGYITSNPNYRDLSPYGTYVYVYNNKYPQYSYGTAIVGDSGSGNGNGASCDIWYPANKQFGTYGTKKHGKDGTNALKNYFKSKGVPFDQVYNPEVTIYILDHGEKGSRGATQLQACKDGKGWVLGGGKALGNQKDNDDYQIKFKSEKTNNSFLGGPDMKLSETYNRTNEKPYTVTTSDLGKIFSGQVRFEFWVTYETVGSMVTGSIGTPANRNSPGYQKPLNRFNPPECVWYCWGRIYETSGKKAVVGRPGNGKDWYEKLKGTKLGMNPQPGSIMCLAYGAYGHVAFVESVASNGDITISDWGKTYQNRGESFPHTMVIKKSSGYKFSDKYTTQGFKMPS